MSGTKLCATCDEIPLNDLLRETYELWSKGGSCLQSKDWLHWHSDLQALAKSSTNCELCRTVLQALEDDLQIEADEVLLAGDMPEDDRRDFNKGLLAISKYSTSGLKVTLSYRSEEQNFRNAHAFFEICLKPPYYSSSQPGDLTASFRIITSHELTFAKSTLSPSDLDPASAQTFSKIESWIQTCIKDHDDCPKETVSAPLPTRVLEVGKSDSKMIYLRQSDTISERAGPYIALSHCWGLERTLQKLKLSAHNSNLPKDMSQPSIVMEKHWRARKAGQTTKSTLSERLQGIHIEELPQTAQDAILITRQLGLPYLWIDSLCMIQDDKEDWLRESVKMASVYLNAYLVIGASNSAADVEGFLHQRPEPHTIKFYQKHLDGMSDSYLGLQVLPPTQKRWTHEKYSVHTGLDPVGQEPLTKRAWCLQERYLARRMLLYGTTQLFWECSKVLIAEDGDFVSRSGDYLENLIRTASIKPTIFEPRPDGDEKVNYRDWYEMIEKYMACSVTHGSDRLPAVAGLATAIADSSGDEYLTGIWRNGMIEGLLWSRAEADIESLKKPKEYRAPSWSWAAVDGNVQFIVYNFIQRCLWKRGIADYESLATYIDHTITGEGSSQFGGVIDGYLRLRVPILPVTDMSTFPSDPVANQMLPFTSPSSDKLFRVSASSKTLFFGGGFDVSEYQDKYQQQPQKLSVLVLARLPDGNTGFDTYIDHRFGLLVEPTGQSGQYRRVGVIDGPVFTYVKSGWLRQKRRWVAESFEPGYILEQTEGELETMPPDPLPEIKSYMATVTLV